MNIFTHNGKITINNPATGQHRTFQVKTAKSGSLAGKRILSFMFGVDNTADYRGIGFVENDRIVLWRYARTDFYEKCARILEHSDNYPQLEFLWEEKCIRCNRTLTNPESIKSGIGPECAGKI